MVGVVSFIVAAGGDHSGVMKIVVPQRIKPVAALFGRTDQFRMLRLIFSDDKSGTPFRGFVDAARDCGQDVIGRTVENLLRGIQAQTVEMKFIYPVAGV